MNRWIRGVLAAFGPTKSWVGVALLASACDGLLSRATVEPLGWDRIAPVQVGDPRWENEDLVIPVTLDSHWFLQNSGKSIYSIRAAVQEDVIHFQVLVALVSGEGVVPAEIRVRRPAANELKLRYDNPDGQEIDVGSVSLEGMSTKTN